jgi:hypothetical protein
VKKLRFAFSTFTLVLAGFAVLSCGSNSSSMMGPVGPSGLQSITLAPAAANAQAYSDGKVPFVATGYYIDPAHTVTPQPALWGVCQQNAPTTAVTVSQTGVAQCAAGASGKYTVYAVGGMTECQLVGPCGTGCTITGTAQLTCP